MNFEEFDQIGTVIECRDLLEELIKNHPESLEEVRDDLQGCLLFYSANSEYEKIEKMKLIEKSLPLEMF